MPDAPILDFALHYRSRGWSIVPTVPTTKKPAGKWKPYQTRVADEPQIRRWFGNGVDYGVAVVLGQVSGGLVCRDYDVQSAYDRWAVTHPNLAATLPTVATAHGRHVYFRAAAADLIFVDLPDGEYRGDSGHYCLLPPSRHPDGPIYKWVVHPPDGAIPFVADVRAAGLLPSHADVTEITETAERTEDDRGQLRTTEVAETTHKLQHGSVISVVSVSCDSDAEIDRAILESIPPAIGRRHRQVFDLARALKAIPRLADAPGDALKPHVWQWHKIGLERGVVATVPFEETWIDFLRAWDRVKFPKGTGALSAILQRAKDSPPLPEAAQYEGPGIRVLVAICRELQKESADKPFFLSCRTAANLLGLGATGQVTAWRWLGLLVHDGILKETERGEPGKGRASRFRYIGDRQA